MIWLSFSHIAVVSIHNDNGLDKFNVVNEAYQSVLAVTEEASEIEHGGQGEYELDEEGTDSDSHQSDAGFQVVVLNFLKLLDELSLLLHKSSLLFASVLLHLISHLLKMLSAHFVLG